MEEIVSALLNLSYGDHVGPFFSAQEIANDKPFCTTSGILGKMIIGRCRVLPRYYYQVCTVYYY